MNHTLALLAALLQTTLPATDTPTVADEAAEGQATQLMRDFTFNSTAGATSAARQLSR